MTNLQINELIKEAYKIGMSQIDSEIKFLLDYIITHNIKLNNVLEIGSKLGGTAYIWRKLAENKVLSIDLPGGQYGGWILQDHPYLGRVIDKRNEFFEKEGISYFVGDSHSIQTISYVQDFFSEEKLDMLFLDGDHTLFGVMQDFLNYKDLVKQGGLIVFHDINNSRYHDHVGVEVHQLWEMLHDNYKNKWKFDQIIADNYWGYGIGIIRT